MDSEACYRQWLDDFETRHLADLRFSDVARALRALSSAYVERRASGLAKHRDLDGLGKRAAFALYYGPLHFLLVQAILRAIASDPGGGSNPFGLPSRGLVVDLGCGTGAAGAAVATATSPPSGVVAIDTHPWALDEARLTYRAFGLAADMRRADVSRFRLPRGTSVVVAAFVVNELSEAARDALSGTLLEACRRGVAVLIVEPISLRVSPWWLTWEKAFVEIGGRADQWRFDIEVPPIVKRLARATSLNPQVMTARSVFVGS
ncbi:MAG: methyltransferase domain-containing protein [Vicinamibacterales bacterium]